MRKISNLCLIAGAILVLGAAGDSDVGRLSIEGVILKLVIGLIVFGAGVLIKLKRERRF